MVAIAENRRATLRSFLPRIGVLFKDITQPRFSKEITELLGPYTNHHRPKVDDQWKTKLQIYLVDNGRRELVPATIRLLRPDRRILFIEELISLGITSFHPKHDEPGEDNIIQEIWDKSPDRGALEKRLKRISKGRRVLINNALHPL